MAPKKLELDDDGDAARPPSPSPSAEKKTFAAPPHISDAFSERLSCMMHFHRKLFHSRILVLSLAKNSPMNFEVTSNLG